MNVRFVVPLRPPGSLSDEAYAEIEVALRVTVSSLLAQTDQSVRIVVAAHRLPRWHAEMTGSVDFLLFPEDDRFPLRRAHRHIDQAFKTAVAGIYAVSRLDADLVVRIDGDDFARRDLAEAFSNMDLTGDGVILTRGYNIEVAPNGDGVKLGNAYEVGAFDRDCGSCKILKSDAFDRAAERVLPTATALLRELPAAPVQTLPPEVVDALFDDAAPAMRDKHALLHLFGNHIEQEKLFDIRPMAESYTMKACGYATHAGPKAGDIHWHRVRRRVPTETIASEFGLADLDMVTVSPRDVSATEIMQKRLVGYLSAGYEKLRYQVGKRL